MLRELCNEITGKHSIKLAEDMADNETKIARGAIGVLHLNFMHVKYIKINDRGLIVGAYLVTPREDCNEVARKILESVPSVNSVNIIVFSEHTNKYIGGCRAERGVDNE